MRIMNKFRLGLAGLVAASGLAFSQPSYAIPVGPEYLQQQYQQQEKKITEQNNTEYFERMIRVFFEPAFRLPVRVSRDIVTLDTKEMLLTFTGLNTIKDTVYIARYGEAEKIDFKVDKERVDGMIQAAKVLPIVMASSLIGFSIYMGIQIYRDKRGKKKKR